MKYFKDNQDGLYVVQDRAFPSKNWQEITETEYQEITNSEHSVFASPVSVSMRQARLALLNAGFLQAVNNVIESMPGQQGQAARIEWDYSNEVLRNQPLTIALAQAIGMTEEQMDALFVEASKL